VIRTAITEGAVWLVRIALACAIGALGGYYGLPLVRDLLSYVSISN
jgi:hypothetical protein